MENFLSGFIKVAKRGILGHSVEEPMDDPGSTISVEHAPDVLSRRMTPLKPGGYQTRIVGTRNNMVGTVYPTGRHPYVNTTGRENLN